MNLPIRFFYVVLHKSTHRKRWQRFILKLIPSTKEEEVIFLLKTLSSTNCYSILSKIQQFSMRIKSSFVSVENVFVLKISTESHFLVPCSAEHLRTSSIKTIYTYFQSRYFQRLHFNLIHPTYILWTIKAFVCILFIYIVQSSSGSFYSLNYHYAFKPAWCVKKWIASFFL